MTVDPKQASKEPMPADGNYYISFDKETVVQQWVLLFYGRSGTQKTRTAAQFPDPLFLSCERGQYGGLISAKEFSPKQIVIKEWQDYLNVLPKLKKGAGKDFKTLVLDSATAFSDHIVRNLLLQAGKEIADWDEWKLNASRMKSVINTLGDLPCHLIIIATERVQEDKKAKVDRGVPSLPGLLAEHLPASVEINLHFTGGTITNQKGEGVPNYIMKSTNHGIWCAKDTSGTLPATMFTEGKDSTYAHLKHLVEN